MCKPQETSLASQTFIPTKHGDPVQSTTAPFQQQHHTLPCLYSHFSLLNSVTTLFHLSFREPISTTTNHKFQFLHFHIWCIPTHYLHLCLLPWPMSNPPSQVFIQCVSRTISSQIPPLLFTSSFLMSLAQFTDGAMDAIWEPYDTNALLSSPFIIFFTLSPQLLQFSTLIQHLISSYNRDTGKGQTQHYCQDGTVEAFFTFSHKMLKKRRTCQQFHVQF